MTKLQVKGENPKSPWSAEQVALISRTIAQGATPDQLKMFLTVAARSGLDPFTRQIYFMKRKVWSKALNDYEEKVSMEASVDGLRVVAQRSKYFAGQGEPEFIEDEKGIPSKCVVRVFRFSPTGERYEAAVGVAYWKEYCPKAGNDFMWIKMPHTMLAKVAEALALRKAFPNDLSGLYTGEEMAQANTEVAPTTSRMAQELSSGVKGSTMTPDEYSALPAQDKALLGEANRANKRRLYAENKKTQEIDTEIPIIEADPDYKENASL